MAAHLHGESVDVGRGGLNASVREPYGVVGRIVPFNHPLQFAAQALAAPLAAGNAVILKPAEQTPVSTLHLADAFAGWCLTASSTSFPAAAPLGRRSSPIPTCRGSGSPAASRPGGR